MAPEGSGKHRILVVEDTPDQRAIIKLSLPAFEVVTAEHGLDGLMKLDRVQPDIIISDVMMPEMDGWEFIRNVRQRPGFENTPVIYVTALSSREDMKRGYETGADVYLTKPYDPVRLHKNIDVFIEKFRLPVRPKRFTLAEVDAEDQRMAQMPRVPPRVTVRPSAAEEELEAPLPQDEDPFRPKTAVPPKPRPPMPPAPARVAPPAPSAAAKPREAQPVRLLLVATEGALLGELRQAAAQTHCEVIAADTSSAAMNKTSLYHPDALLLHWQLPDSHAPVLAQLFSESKECRGRPVVVVSDKGLSRGERRQLDQLGVFDVLRRPIEAQALRDLADDLAQVLRSDLRRGRMTWEQVEQREQSLRRLSEPTWEG